MVEMHDSNTNTNTCKLNDNVKQIQDTKITNVNVKKYSVDVSLLDLIKGKNVRMNEGFYASQLDGLELDSDTESNTESNTKSIRK